MRALVAAVLLLAGCRAGLRDGVFACVQDADCPPAMSCFDGFCSRGAPSDGGPDAGDAGPGPCGPDCRGGPCVLATCPAGTCILANAIDGTECGVNHQVCRGGACECAAGFADCNAAVPGCETELATSVDHCGRCDQPCAHPSPSRCQVAVCSGGSCGLTTAPRGTPCGLGQRCCGSTCVSTDSDGNNCGGCGIACPSMMCNGGQCTCSTLPPEVGCPTRQACGVAPPRGPHCACTPGSSAGCDDGQTCNTEGACEYPP